jgi:glycosyltransferase involved in cell wall biosynthesis
MTAPVRPAQVPSAPVPSPQVLSILIPLFNENEFIGTLLDRVVAAPLPGDIGRELIIVDDGSNDGSAEVVRAFAASHPGCRINLIVHEKNRGKGAAVRTAIAAATGAYSIIQDADLEYDPCEYPKLLGPLLNGEADVVYGSRFMAADEKRVHYFWHALANRLLTGLCNIVADLNLTDMETCYKAFRTSFVKTIPCKATDSASNPK